MIRSFSSFFHRHLGAWATTLSLNLVVNDDGQCVFFSATILLNMRSLLVFVNFVFIALPILKNNVTAESLSAIDRATLYYSCYVFLLCFIHVTKTYLFQLFDLVPDLDQNLGRSHRFQACLVVEVRCFSDAAGTVLVINLNIFKDNIALNG